METADKKLHRTDDVNHLFHFDQEDSYEGDEWEKDFEEIDENISKEKARKDREQKIHDWKIEDLLGKYRALFTGSANLKTYQKMLELTREEAQRPDCLFYDAEFFRKFKLQLKDYRWMEQLVYQVFKDLHHDLFDREVNPDLTNFYRTLDQMYSKMTIPDEWDNSAAEFLLPKSFVKTLIFCIAVIMIICFLQA